LSVLAYLFCQQADVLLGMHRALGYPLMALCVSSTAWMWIAARALFDDDFTLSAPVVGAALALAALGLAANVPYLPETAGTVPAAAIIWLSRAHGAAMLIFTGAALWEIARGWSGDLVEPRRVARRWVAMGIGLYAAVALVIELALRGQAIGRLLPALHVAGIGAVTLALAVLVARRSLDEVLGVAPVVPVPAPTTPSAPPIPIEPVPAELADSPSRPNPALARLSRAMTEERLYRREGLTLANLAGTLGMGEAALRGLINQELGYRNFNDFLHHYRLQEAAVRLATQDLPILTIALECGYGSIGPFNRAFRQRLGMTPSEYRGASRLPKGSATN
jgi:AraC-like DNA-binding protein